MRMMEVRSCRLSSPWRASTVGSEATATYARSTIDEGVSRRTCHCPATTYETNNKEQHRTSTYGCVHTMCV